MKRLLVLNFFPAFFPTSSGGEQRYYYLYQHLSKNYDVTLLSSTYGHVRDELVEWSPRFRERRIPKEDVHDAIHHRLNQEGVGPELSALVCALAAGRERGFQKAYRELVRQADIVIHECPHLLDYDEELGFDGKPRVYNSYNVEFLLARDIFNQGSGDNYATHVHRLESRLVRASSRVFATCEDERAAFREWYGCPAEKLGIVANGFEPAGSGAAVAPPAGWSVRRPFTVFMGSGHPPNVQAAQFILDSLAPAFPNVAFVFIGSVCGHLRSGAENVHLLDLVEEGAKSWLLRECDVALNCVFSGAGTNLKIIDYLSHGAAVITTPFGVRGLRVVDGEHCHVRSLADFASALGQVLDDSPASRVIGSAGRTLVYRDYTWERIAEDMSQELDLLAPLPLKSSPMPKKPRLLFVNDFPVDTPRGGGEVRINEITHELSKDFDVSILCLSAEGQRRETILAPRLRQIAIPKTNDHLNAEASIDRMSDVSAGDIVSLLYCMDNRALRTEFHNAAQFADIVVFVHPYLAPLEELAPSGRKIVYEALNHESSLKRSLLAEHPLAEELLSAVEAAEARLVAVSDATVCVSKEDRDRFSPGSPQRRRLLVPNGVSLPGTVAVRRSASTRLRAVFVGSRHAPNVEAARFLLRDVAAALPELQFLILGSVCDALDGMAIPDNVELAGWVSSVEKEALMASAAIGLNPVFSGSGSNLKLADYFASGLAVVSTPLGVRGYDLVDGTQLRIVPADGFVSALSELVFDSAARSRISDAARQFAAGQLTWNKLAKDYGKELRRLLPPPAEPSRSLLVVTYRFTDNAQGGAELYLSEMLKQLALRKTFTIDIAAIDVDQISNRLHFSAVYTPVAETGHVPAHIRNLFVFSLGMPPESEIRRGSEMLFALWQQESLFHGRQFIDRYKEPLLMGGWYIAELSPEDGTPRRWTGPLGEIFCPAGMTDVDLAGFSPSEKRVRVLMTGRVLIERKVAGDFQWSLELPAGGPAVLQIECEPERAPDDPRQRGLYFSAVRATVAGVVLDIPIESDYESLMRSTDPALWVESLIALAEGRDRDKDDVFRRIRGPHSADLEAFLRQHGREYDAALIQGVPFSVTPEALRCTKEVALPVLLLPHVHIEDRYYHWRTFNEAFRAAALVAAAPNEAKAMYFDRIGASSAIVPGGGIDPAEFVDLRSARKSFAAVYPHATPFLLVLGRKTGAKNYRLAIAAAGLLRDRGIKVNVVLIGPDEDGVGYREPFVFSLGRQARHMVLGALASSVCLVSMSESESFGIVLLESWMCGRPVIANRNCLAFAQLVDDRENGVLCSDSGEIADAVARFVADPALGDRMAALGRAKASRSYTWSAVAAKFEELLLKVELV